MNIGIIGIGKVGRAFLSACNKTHTLDIVCAKAGREAAANAKIRKEYDVALSDDLATVLLQADVVLLTVPDGQIEAVAEKLAAELAQKEDCKLTDKVCLHCSGSLGLEPLEALAANGIHCGSLHPLQSFAAEQPVFTGIGMAVAGDIKAQLVGREIAEKLGAKAFVVPPEARRAYHAAACFCSNYLVTVTALAQQLLAKWTPDEKTALEVLMPLINGTVSNMQQVSRAREALTGPIARGDIATVSGHLEVLPQGMQKVYRALGEQTVMLACANGSIDMEMAEQLQRLLKFEQ